MNDDPSIPIPSSRKRLRANYDDDDPRGITVVSQPLASARHNPHVMRACNTCRGHKHKCDGVKPICGPCASSPRLSTTCRYSTEIDLRTKTGRLRVKQLEEQLEQERRENREQLELERRKNQELQREIDVLRLSPVGSRRLSALDRFQSWSLEVDTNTAHFQTGWRSSPRHDDDEQDDLINEFTSCQTRAVRLNDDEETVSVASFSPLSLTRGVSPLPELEGPMGDLAVATGDTFHLQDSDFDQGLHLDAAVAQYDSNFNIHWSIYIASKVPDIVEELDRLEHDRLLDQYLESCQVSVLKTRFRVDMARMLAAEHMDPKPHCFNNSLYSPSLHCAILAAAIALEPAARDHPQLSRWLERLRTAADDLRAEQFSANAATASTAHTMSILAQLSAAEPTGARMAHLILRRASELVRTNGAGEDPLMRWCRVSLFVQGVDIALHTGFLPGSAPSISLESLQLLPAELADENPHDIRAFVARAELMHIISRFVAAQGSPRASPFNLQGYRQELFNWRDKLDPFHEHNTDDRNVVLLHLTFAWAEMLLVRPMYWHTGPKVRQISDDACRQFMQLVDEFGRCHGLDKSPVRLVSMLFFIGIATLVATLGLDPSENFRRQTLVVQAKSAIKALAIMGQTKPCAQGYSDTLSARLKEVQKRYSVSGVRGQIGRAKSLSSKSILPSPLNPDRGRATDRKPPRRKSTASIGPIASRGDAAVPEDSANSVEGVQTFLFDMQNFDPAGRDSLGGEGEPWLFPRFSNISRGRAAGISALEPIYEGERFTPLSVIARDSARSDVPAPSVAPQDMVWRRGEEHTGIVPTVFQGAYGHSTQQDMPEASAAQPVWAATPPNLLPSSSQHFIPPAPAVSTTQSATPQEFYGTPSSANGSMEQDFAYSHPFPPLELTITDPNSNVMWWSPGTDQVQSGPPTRNYAEGHISFPS